ncbi:MAG: 4Fe-4S binding protein, partial [Phycisphaerales bacterium JB059]
MSAAASREGGGRKVSLPVIDCASGERPERAPRSRVGRWRAGVLVAVHLAIIAHVTHWLLTGSTVSPVEPSESMETLERGSVNAGFIFFAVSLLLTLVFGRFVCGWACHIVALQDLCGWMMKKVGVRPKPFRSRLLLYGPLALALYMFVWPTFKRVALAPALRAAEIDWPAFLRPVEPVRQLSSGLIVEDFWETFPAWYVAIPFLLIIGFATVYFLGAKGFCTYACPYGGFFAPVDKVAPVRIRVTDACAQCGHCTAVCTSNVRVHEEVRDYGMVVDPGCMKCLDCISACPNDALYLGVGRPAVGARARSPETAKKASAARERRYDLTWRGEIAMVVVLLVIFIATRGLFDLVPMLLAGALAGIGVFLVLMAYRVVREENARIYGIKLKYKGRVRALGWAYLVVVGLLGLGVLWGLPARHARGRGDMLYTPMDVQFATILRPEFEATGEEARRAREALGWSARAARPRAGGWGWRLDPERRVREAYLHALLGEHDAALEQLREVLERGRPTDSLINQIGQVIRASGGGREDLVALDREALAQRPELHGVRLRLAQLAASQGRGGEAEALWAEAREAFGDRSELLLSEASYRLMSGDGARAAEMARDAGASALDASHGEPGVALRAAGMLLQLGRADEAMGMVRRAGASRRASPETRLGAAGLLAAVGVVEEAKALIEGVLGGLAGD